jgi:Holliday junction DNA helicase RuvA
LLSGLSASELVAAIRADDAKRLCSVKGIGKKTAEQILLDLRDRVAELPLAGLDSGGSAVLHPAAPPAERRPVALLDAEQALMSIGYSDKEARKAVDRAAGEQDPAALDSERLIRDALRG